jgi:hypothetical protein
MSPYRAIDGQRDGQFWLGFVELIRIQWRCHSLILEARNPYQLQSTLRFNRGRRTGSRAWQSDINATGRTARWPAFQSLIRSKTKDIGDR